MNSYAQNLYNYKIIKDKETYLEYINFIYNWKWEWFTTLTYKIHHTPINCQQVEDHFKIWYRNLCKVEKIQVGAFYIIVYLPGFYHIHCLMVGKGNVKDSIEKKTLLDVDPVNWENAWNYQSKILPMDSSIKTTAYVINHLLKYDKEILDYGFKGRLLEKLRKEISQALIKQSQVPESIIRRSLEKFVGRKFPEYQLHFYEVTNYHRKFDKGETYHLFTVFIKTTKLTVIDKHGLPRRTTKRYTVSFMIPLDQDKWHIGDIDAEFQNIKIVKFED